MSEGIYRVPDWIMEVECDVEVPWPDTTDWSALTRIAITALLNVAPEFDNPRMVVSLLFTSDSEIRALNREWRQRDKPTNVLSFPMLARDELLALAPDGPPVLLGDIALAYETCAGEAEQRGIGLRDHAAHLIVHGLLHLAGHDHEISDEDAAAMEALETMALARMGVADPYGDRA